MTGETAKGIVWPIVQCPACASHMRLAGAGPDPDRPGVSVTFDCDCGFQTRLPDRGTDARGSL